MTTDSQAWREFNLLIAAVRMAEAHADEARQRCGVAEAAYSSARIELSGAREDLERYIDALVFPGATP